MTADLITLRSDRLEAVVDPGRGADILSLVHRGRGLDVLFRTPWHRHAEAVRDGAEPRTQDPRAGWMERYRGGWQVNCPNAGPPRLVHGGPVGFHGEANRTAWDVLGSTPSEADLQVELFSVPVTIERRVVVEGPTLTVTDTLTNLSDVALDLDYVSHPAFGGEFLRGGVTIELDDGRFVSDPETSSTPVAPGTAHRWPLAVDRDDAPYDLSDVPAEGRPSEIFGYLEALRTAEVTLVSRGTGLAASIAWDGTRLPYAWFWQELEATEGFPWFRRARALAIEPASTPTSGPDRPTLGLGPRQSLTLPVSITLTERTLP